jgi:hypothetical protein
MPFPLGLNSKFSCKKKQGHKEIISGDGSKNTSSTPIMSCLVRINPYLGFSYLAQHLCQFQNPVKMVSQLIFGGPKYLIV